MAHFGDTRMDWNPWAWKVVGSIIGVGISMVMIAPRSVKNGVYRAFLGTVAGMVFATPMQNLAPWLRGETPEMWLASACATGFTVWFVLEATARFLSSKDTLRRLLEEMVRLKGPDK